MHYVAKRKLREPHIVRSCVTPIEGGNTVDQIPTGYNAMYL